jgi:serine protease Do
MKFIDTSIYGFLLSVLVGGSIYLNKIQKEQEELRSLLLAKLNEQPMQNLVQKEIIIERVSGSSEAWSDLQAKLKDTIVQVFSQIAAIDLLQPYKTPSQGQATGSGFFINPDGEIITNAHVVDQAKSVYVQIPSLGKHQFKVDIVGVSPDRDIALLKVNHADLVTIKKELGEIKCLALGDSSMVHRADEIMTLGYPLGQQGLKSTVGVVSGRESHLIQIDAPINPGNSGGPSVDRLGRVVGINTLYAPDAQNVGYVIPVNELKIVLDDLRHVKLLRKPFLGVLFNNASDALTSYLGNPVPGGLYVVDVYKDSPLHKAGVQKGDMIYQINGHRLDYYGEFAWTEDKISIIDYVAQLKLGQKIDLVVYRRGKQKTFSFAFDQSELLPIRKIYPGYEKIDYEIVAGMVIQPLTINHLPFLINISPSLAKYTEMKYQMEPALIITHIFPDSEAQRSRSLSLGAIVKEINGKSVKTLADLRESLYKGLTSENLTVETAEGVFVVCPFKKVLTEDMKLAKDYFIPVSDTMQVLIAKAGLDKKNTGMILVDNQAKMQSVNNISNAAA